MQINSYWVCSRTDRENLSKLDKTLRDQKALVPYSIDGSDSPVFSMNINHFPNHSKKNVVCKNS